MASGKTLQSTIEISGVLSPSLQATINSAVDKLADMAEETLESADAATRLVAEMSTQEDVLKTLQKAYAGYVASGEESSENAQDLADTIRAVSGELEENRSTLQAAEKAAKNLTGTQEEAADAYTTLENKINSQQDELAALRRQYANVVLEQGESSNEARQLANRISDLSGELNQNRQRLNDVAEAAEKTGKSMEDSSEGYTVLKNVIANLVTEGIDKAVEAFKELATEGDNSLAMLSAKTGATGAELQGFEDVMYEVYNANYGENLGDVSDTLSTVIQMTDDLDNASLAQITKNSIALNDVYGFDTVESLRAVNSLMDQFGITSDQAYNLIVQGAQNGLNQNDDLLDTINEYSVQFSYAGYSADEMFNMLQNGTESGTWSVDKLGDAVKEFNIRASDGTIAKVIEENAEALGLSAKEAERLGEAVKSGDTTAYDEMIQKLQDIDDYNLRYQMGVEMFGTMWEDLGEDAVFSLMQTEGAIDSTIDAMGQMDSAAYDTLESSLSQLGRTVKAEVVQPITDKLTPVLKDAVNFVNSKVAPAVDWILDHLPEIGIALGTVGAVIVAMNWGSIVGQTSKLSKALSGFMSKLAAIPAPVLAVIGIVAALAAGFTYLWKNNEDFRDKVTGIWEQLKGSFSELGVTISDTIGQLMPLLSELATTVLTLFAQIVEAVLPILLQLIAEILPVVIDLISQLLPIIMKLVSSVLSVLVDIIEQLLPPILQIIETVLPVLVQLIQTLLPIFMQIVQMVLPVLIQLINTLLPIIMQVISAVLPLLVEILNMLTPILNMIVSLLQPIFDLIITLVPPILDLIMLAITPLINTLMVLINSVLQPIMPIIRSVASVITSVLGGAISALQPIIQGLIGVFQGLIDFISGVFSGDWSQAWNGIVSIFKGIFNLIPSVVESVINGAIDVINGIIKGINDISKYIGVKIGLIPHVSLPRFATGGFTEGPSLAGEAGMEAVISFDPAYRDKNIGIWEKAGQLLGVLGNEEQGAGLTSKAGELLTLDDFSLGSLADGTNIVIYYDFSNFTWSPQIQTSGEDEDDLMARLKAHEAEFFDWLEEFIKMREVAQYA